MSNANNSPKKPDPQRSYNAKRGWLTRRVNVINKQLAPKPRG